MAVLHPKHVRPSKSTISKKENNTDKFNECQEKES